LWLRDVLESPTIPRVGAEDGSACHTGVVPFRWTPVYGRQRHACTIKPPLD